MGAAPEVPPKTLVSVPEPANADTKAPGAPISGLILLSPKLGPREDEGAMWPTNAMFWAGSKRTLTPVVMACLIKLASASVITKPGTVIGRWPPSLLPVSPDVVAPIRPASAPPSLIFLSFSDTWQAFRSSKIIFPLSALGANGAQPLRLAPAPSPY